jgi:hypothetical protein
MAQLNAFGIKTGFDAFTELMDAIVKSESFEKVRKCMFTAAL